VHYAVHRVLFRESIFSVYAIVIPVRPLFATSSLEYKTAGTHSDIALGTALRRACGASCIRLEHYLNAYFDHKTLFGKPKAQSMNLWFDQSAYMGARVGALPKSCTPSFANFTLEVLELWVTSR